MDNEKILRNLEYIGGGLTTLKAMCNSENKSQARYSILLDDWIETLYDTIEMIERSDNYAENHRRPC